MHGLEGGEGGREGQRKKKRDLFITGKTDVEFTEESPVRLERSQAQGEMVSLFGSERKKRAYAAYQRNRVGSEALETALVSAVSQADTVQDMAAEGKKLTYTYNYSRRHTVHIVIENEQKL